GTWTPVFSIGPGRITKGGDGLLVSSNRNGSNVRVLLARPAKPPGLQKLMPGLMDRRGLMVNRTHKRQAIHPRGKTGQMLADPNSGNAGGDRAEGAPDLPRCIGLWVPCLKLAWSAHQHQQDDRPVPPTMIPRERVQIGQAEAERAQPHAPYAQEVAAADTGRGSHHALTDRDHQWSVFAGPRETHRSHHTNWRPTYLGSQLRDRCQSVFQVRVALLLAVGWREIGGLFQFCRF